MFNLDGAITEWRRKMSAARVGRQEILDELEAHLREDVKRRMASGIAMELAFKEATATLGQAKELHREFKKNRSGWSVTERLRVGICGVVVGFGLFLSGVAICLCFRTALDRIVASLAVSSILFVAFAWKHAVPRLPVITDPKRRWSAALGCIAFGAISASWFCNYILPHFETSRDRELPAIGLWAVFLIASFGSTGVALSLTTQQREQWGMSKRSKSVHL